MNMKMFWMALATLAAAAAVGWYFFSQPLVVDVAGVPAKKAVAAVTPVTAQPAKAAVPVAPASSSSPPPAVLPSTDGAPATAPVVAEPEQQQAQPAEDGEHSHEDGQAPKLSPAVIEAIREIRKPAPGEGQVIEHPDGTLEMNLGHRYRSVPVATVDKDGKLHVDYHGEAQVPETGN